MTTPVFIIAEAGVNHNGDIGLATRLIDIAAESGADAVKFQSFRAAALVIPDAPKAQYQVTATDAAESQLEMLRKLEISAADHETLFARAKARGIVFLSTPFDLDSLDFLTRGLGLGLIKVASGEITNAPFLLAIGRAAERVILSTGMSGLSEIEQALGVLAFGYTAPASARPVPGDFERAFAAEAGQQALRERVTLMHCTTEYPAPVGEVNLRALDTLAKAFRLPVGFSDHSQGIHVSLAAVARGAKVVEKHFTSDRTLPGPDHGTSLEPDELLVLVHQARDIEAALGDGVKRPTASEWKNLGVARKSLVATAAIRAGDTFSPDNVACKRPGGGLSPFRYWDTLGTVAGRSYEPGELLDG